MSNVTYYVAMGFIRGEAGELVAMDPVEAQSANAAIARARSLGNTKAGAVAFSPRRSITCSAASLRSRNTLAYTTISLRKNRTRWCSTTNSSASSSYRSIPFPQPLPGGLRVSSSRFSPSFAIGTYLLPSADHTTAIYADASGPDEHRSDTLGCPSKARSLLSGAPLEEVETRTDESIARRLQTSRNFFRTRDASDIRMPPTAAR